MTEITFTVPDERVDFILELLHSMEFVSNIRVQQTTAGAASAVPGESGGAEETEVPVN